MNDKSIKKYFAKQLKVKSKSIILEICWKKLYKEIV